MNKCRISNTDMIDLFSLGNLHISDFIPLAKKSETTSDLSLCFSEEDKLVQLKTTVLANTLYGKYWYRSGINQSMRYSLNDVVTSIRERCQLNPNDVWLDIGSNDGTLLSCVPKNIIKIGIDPVEESYVREAIRYGDDIIQDFFSAGVYLNGKYGQKKAKVVTAIAMFYDLEDPCGFLRDINEIMDDEGTLILQLSYTPLMINQLAFDNICHEHIFYYSLTSLQNILAKENFKIVDCTLNDVNGGSFRVYIKKKIANISNFKTSPFRDVANFRCNSILKYEDTAGFNNISKYTEFYKNIEALKHETVSFIKTEKGKGKTIWAYGASTKGNTLLQWYGLDNTLIDGIAERSPYKYGLKTVGTNIPIYSEDHMRSIQPDYLLILPWHFVEEFKSREQEYLKSGGTFIVPCPKFELISMK